MHKTHRQLRLKPWTERAWIWQWKWKWSD